MQYKNYEEMRKEKPRGWRFKQGVQRKDRILTIRSQY
jgi:hypothetical protein